MNLRRLTVAALAGCTALAVGAPVGAQQTPDAGATLVGRAVLSAATFAEGPPSGAQIPGSPVNGQVTPFANQPVQGFSALLPARRGRYFAMSDNGFGSLANSADYNLRVYTIHPELETARRGDGSVDVEGFFELRDPNGHVPFAITNTFTDERVLTGADFDIESMQRGRDGSFWFGEEFGPFLLHTDDAGVLLEAPIPLPDPDGPGPNDDAELRAPQNPYSEEGTTTRLMNAVRTHARRNGATRTPVVSPWHVMLADANPETNADTRPAPPTGSGLVPASSEIHDVGQLKNAGYPVVPYTVNDAARMSELLDLGVNGIISDSPEVLYDAVAAYDADDDGTPGDLLLPDGRIDASRFDAQGHRGARNLRPENTLPAMEAALDELMTTLETDTGVTADGVAVLDHNPEIESAKCRRRDGSPYLADDEVLIKDLTAAELQSSFVCDQLLEGRPTQTNDRSLSPVTVAYAEQAGLADAYTIPTLEQLFDFAEFYAAWYSTGPGAAEPDAKVRAANATEVRFNVETKINPRADLAERTVGPEAFVDVVGGTIAGAGLEDRADIQSFDWRTLLRSHEEFPAIRTVFLLGDFPIFDDPTVEGSDDGTNLQPGASLQDEASGNTPWLAGLYWPYRVTELSAPRTVASSGGFEGMAISRDRRFLYPMLEQPLVGDTTRSLLISEFDIARGAYTGDTWTYGLDERGTAIGDFQLFSGDGGVVIERDGTTGDLGGFKTVYEITLGKPGTAVDKELVVDLLDIADPDRISEPATPGDVGLGDPFAFPFVTIEDLVVENRRTLLVANDNNFPFSVGRHLGATTPDTATPDDSEIIRIRLDDPLG